MLYSGSVSQPGRKNSNEGNCIHIVSRSGTFFKRNNLKGEDVAEYALKENIGLYCYASTGDYTKHFPPVSHYLSKPLDAMPNLDERNIALLARVLNGLPLDE